MIRIMIIEGTDRITSTTLKKRKERQMREKVVNDSFFCEWTTWQIDSDQNSKSDSEEDLVTSCLWADGDQEESDQGSIWLDWQSSCCNCKFGRAGRFWKCHKRRPIKWHRPIQASTRKSCFKNHVFFCANKWQYTRHSDSMLQWSKR